MFLIFVPPQQPRMKKDLVSVFMHADWTMIAGWAPNQTLVERAFVFDPCNPRPCKEAHCFNIYIVYMFAVSLFNKLKECV